MALRKSGIIEEPCMNINFYLILKVPYIIIIAKAGKLNINNSVSKLRTYSQFKQDFQTENYLLNFNNFEKRKYFTKLRISSHDLQVDLYLPVSHETGRYNKPRKTPVEKRICPYCNMQNIEDEFHFVMECPNYKELRKSFFHELNHVSYFDNLPDNKCKFIWIMKRSNGDCDVSKIVIHYIYRLFQHRKQSLHNINFTKQDS